MSYYCCAGGIETFVAALLVREPHLVVEDFTEAAYQLWVLQCVQDGLLLRSR